MLTVPSGHTNVIKTITMTVNGGSAPVTFGWRINGTGSSNMLWRSNVAVDTTTILTLSVALAAGDTLHLALGTLGTSAVAVVVSGYDFLD